MKKVAVVLLTLVFTATAFAGVNSKDVKKVEDNLLVGLNSDNLGLKTSSAYFLGEYGTSHSVNALMSVLKNGQTEEERISAAVALMKINTEQAKFAVKQRAKFDDSERVRRLCAMFSAQNEETN